VKNEMKHKNDQIKAGEVTIVGKKEEKPPVADK
jgi:hypothetical protein